MSAIKKWAEGKPFLLALAAPQIAMSAQNIHLLFNDVKGHKLLNREFGLPDLPSWFTLYRSHRETALFIKELFAGFSTFSSESIGFAEMVLNVDQAKKELEKPEVKQQLAQMTPEEKADKRQQALAIQEAMLAESFKDLDGDIKGKPIAPELQADFLTIFSQSLPGQFYLFVAVPCWILYRDSATNLYRQARLGDYDSLEKLLRLDALLIHDRLIGRQIQKLRINGKYTAYENLIEAVLKRPKGKSTRKKMKYAIAGLISGISIAMNHPLTEPQIRDLFDAIAHDTLGQNIDTDLPESQEAFAKAIQRDRTYWGAFFRSDKNN